MSPSSGAVQVCTYCVMDSANPSIRFDSNGRCNCCIDAEQRRSHEWWPGAEGQTRMNALVETLRAAGRGRKYDAMIGLSGGIDSAYLAHLAVRKLGLRVLAVHVDGGWNTEPAVHNIELLVRQLDLDLHTLVIEWDEMRDLQVAFLKASVLNQDIPQDHAFFATLYRTARQFGLHHFLSGVNYATECVVPPLWGHPSMDGKHLRAIQQRFGAAALATFPVMGLTEFLWMTRVRRQVTIHRPLNYLAYDKEQARVELREAYGWRDYGGKHCESRFTKFYQEIYLPKKFHFDKRRLHLSSLIVSGLMTRAQALEELATSITTAEQEKRDMRFVAKKLAINVAELESYLSSAPIDHLTYPNQMSLHGRLTSLKRLARRFSKAPP